MLSSLIDVLIEASLFGDGCLLGAYEPKFGAWPENMTVAILLRGAR
jgi:hypothetical protein